MDGRRDSKDIDSKGSPSMPPISMSVAPLDGTSTFGTMSARFPHAESKSRRPQPTPEIKPGITKDELDDLIEHYTILNNLALHSKRENANKEEILRVTQSLLNFYMDHQNDPRLFTPSTDDPSDTKPTNIKNLQIARTALQQNLPLTDICYFGTRCTFTASDGKTSDFDAKTNTTPMLQNGDSRETTINFDGGSDTATITESIDAKGNFTSTSRLPSNLDGESLKKWACTAITSFFAAAPPHSNPVFEDGFSKNQLAALVSYCSLMGYKFEISAKQALRASADTLLESAKKLPPDAMSTELAKHEGTLQSLEKNKAVDEAEITKLLNIQGVQSKSRLACTAASKDLTLGYDEASWKTSLAKPENRKNIPFMDKGTLDKLIPGQAVLSTTARAASAFGDEGEPIASLGAGDDIGSQFGDDGDDPGSGGPDAIDMDKVDAEIDTSHPGGVSRDLPTPTGGHD